jgi:ABC-type bacteriocin/lantibiotic exporter with double-glycine peptidase domain
VLVGGCDLSDIDVRGVRRQIGMVPQKPYVFGTTLRANIAFAAPETTHAEIENAARLACIHDDIAAMPLGYDTLLTAGGASLSGGQRQRIALARALLQRPAILLLDEATSALDAMTERQVLANLEKWPCTRIVVAHRLSTIVRADMIVVMDQGRIVETGTHAELLARNGQYTALVRAQLGESTEAPRSAPARSGESPKVARPMHVVRAVGGGR